MNIQISHYKHIKPQGISIAATTISSNSYSTMGVELVEYLIGEGAFKL